VKKIAFIVQRYGKEVNGGAELEAKHYAERLKEHYEVTVFTTCAKDYLTWKNEYPEGEEMIDGVHVLRFPTVEERDVEEFRQVRTKILELLNREDDKIDDGMLDLWLRKQGPDCPALIDAIEKGKDDYDVFLFMTYLYYPTVYGIPKVKEKAILIPTAHDEPYLRLPVYRKLFKNVKGLFYNSRSEQTLVESLFEVKSIPSAVGGCGVMIPEDIDMQGFRNRYPIPDEYVVYAGRVDVVKGCRELLDFWHEYNEKRKALKKNIIPIVLIGKNAMDVEASDEVFPLGFVSDNDKYAAIQGSMFLTLPSPLESLSIAVLEAFSLNRPVLVNGNCLTLKDHCLYSNGGLFYHNYEEFEACMDYLTTHPREREELGKNGNYYCFCNYAWEDIMRRLERLIEL